MSDECMWGMGVVAGAHEQARIHARASMHAWAMNASHWSYRSNGPEAARRRPYTMGAHARRISDIRLCHAGWRPQMGRGGAAKNYAASSRTRPRQGANTGPRALRTPSSTSPSACPCLSEPRPLMKIPLRFEPRSARGRPKCPRQAGGELRKILQHLPVPAPGRGLVPGLGPCESIGPMTLRRLEPEPSLGATARHHRRLRANPCTRLRARIPA